MIPASYYRLYIAMLAHFRLDGKQTLDRLRQNDASFIHLNCHLGIKGITAKDLARALKVNQTLTSLNLILINSNNTGLKSLAKSLKKPSYP